MSIEISWLVKNHIIYWQDKGAGSVEAVKQAEAIVIQMLEESPAPVVHVVLNLHAVTQMPSLADSIRAKYEFPNHPKCGWNVFVGMKDPMQKMLISMLGGILKSRVQQVESDLAALQYLETVDKNLPDLSPYKSQLASKV